jgi:Sensors of blue-light using FAD
MQLIQPDQPIINPGFYQLVYCSMLKQAFSKDEMKTLITHAQESNLRNKVTGVLMIDGCVVVQWIEGSRTTVRALWAKLLKDTRHHCVVELMHRDYQEQRMYPDWAMQPTTRAELIATVQGAHELALAPIGLPNPWAQAIGKLCDLIDPAFGRLTSAMPLIHTEGKSRSAAF